MKKHEKDKEESSTKRNLIDTEQSSTNVINNVSKKSFLASNIEHKYKAKGNKKEKNYKKLKLMKSETNIKNAFGCHDCADGTPTFTMPSTKDDDHPNSSKYKKARKKLIIAAILVTVFMIIEFVGGIIANSLAIFTDAAHMFSDLAAFLISIGALFLTTRDSSAKLSFGQHRAEILGVLISILMIQALTGALVFEAVRRIRSPEIVNGKIIFGVATAGLIFNLIIMQILKGHGHGHSHGHSHSSNSKNTRANKKKNLKKEDNKEILIDYEEIDNIEKDLTRSRNLSQSHSAFIEIEEEVSEDNETNINVRSAWLHAVGDIIQSVGVMIAGVIIQVRPDQQIADPICTFIFSVLVLITTFRMLVDAVNILMAGTPQGIDFHDVHKEIMSSVGVLEVHDLHIWCLTMGKPLLSVHVIIDYENPDETLSEIRRKLLTKFKISHSTIQMERQAQLENGIYKQYSVLLNTPPPPQLQSQNILLSSGPEDSCHIDFKLDDYQNNVVENGNNTEVSIQIPDYSSQLNQQLLNSKEETSTRTIETKENCLTVSSKSSSNHVNYNTNGDFLNDENKKKLSNDLEDSIEKNSSLIIPKPQLSEEIYFNESQHMRNSRNTSEAQEANDISSTSYKSNKNRRRKKRNKLKNKQRSVSKLENKEYLLNNELNNKNSNEKLV